MLKKLVKYGNSNALVLDKALLELLNIAEGSVVKIKTDGTSLIITPQIQLAEEAISQTITPEASMKKASQSIMAQQAKNPEEGKAYAEELARTYQKYVADMTTLYSPIVQEEFQKLEELHKGNRSDPDYAKANLALRQKYVPGLIELDKEVQALSQKYAPDNLRYEDTENTGKLTFAFNDFKRVHEKYKHLIDQMAVLMNNPDYINESVVLAEKYQFTKNSPEYIKEYLELITKFIPEYAQYQDELKKAGQALS